MTLNPEQIVDAALHLSESDRLWIASRLLETLPDDSSGLPDDDSEFMAELERRAGDGEPTIPVADLWKQD